MPKEKHTTGQFHITQVWGEIPDFPATIQKKFKKIPEGLILISLPLIPQFENLLLSMKAQLERYWLLYGNSNNQEYLDYINVPDLGDLKTTFKLFFLRTLFVQFAFTISGTAVPCCLQME